MGKLGTLNKSRSVKVFRNDIWTQCKFSELKIGEEFQILFEKNLKGKKWKVKDNPYVNSDNIWSVDIDEVD